MVLTFHLNCPGHTVKFHKVLRRKKYLKQTKFEFQYLAIIKKMNVLGCNDKFFNIFINTFVFIASFSIAFLHNMVPGRMSLNYFMCTGEDPADYQYMESKVI